MENKRDYSQKELYDILHNDLYQKHYEIYQEHYEIYRELITLRKNLKKALLQNNTKDVEVEIRINIQLVDMHIARKEEMFDKIKNILAEYTL